MKNIFVKTLLSSLLVGTLDILAAFLHYYVSTGKNPSIILPYIASGVFGKDAFNDSNTMFILGLMLHFFIAICFTFFFFLVYSFLRRILKSNIIIAIIYAVFIWLVMQIIVIPLSRISQPQITFIGALQAIGILALCIGLPLSIIAFKTKKLVFL